MSRRTETLAPDYFEGLYARDSDPWKFDSSAYERDKYVHTLAALRRPRYAHALEIGCSIGVLTRQLAQRCDRLIALDVSATALQEARRRCGDQPHVQLHEMFVPRQWPDGVFDLILLSEVVYYLDEKDVAELARRVTTALAPGADIVLVHWTGPTDYPLSGDQAADRFIAHAEGLADVVKSERRDAYRLDVLARK